MYKKCQPHYHYSVVKPLHQIIWGSFQYQYYHIVLLMSQQQIVGLGMTLSNFNYDDICHKLNVQLRGTELLHNDDEIKHCFRCYERGRPMIVNLHGTPFQHRVWKVLNHIPSGQIITYQQIADYIGHPQAARAVGQAVGRNPVSYLTPCHRVCPSNGQLGHFRWGSEIKHKLLQAEGIANIPINVP